jgi:hypothetical protein
MSGDRPGLLFAQTGERVPAEARVDFLVNTRIVDAWIPAVTTRVRSLARGLGRASRVLVVGVMWDRCVVWVGGRACFGSWWWRLRG